MVFSNTGPLLAPYDSNRNPLAVALRYRNSGGPHSLNERWAYTPAANRQALLNTYFARILVTTAPSSQQTAEMVLRYSNGVQVNIMRALLAAVAVGDVLDPPPVPTSAAVLSGDTLSLATQITGVDGVYTQRGPATLTEFKEEPMFAIRHGYDITWLVAEVPSPEYPGWFDHTLVNPGLLRQHPPLTFEAIEEARECAGRIPARMVIAEVDDFDEEVGWVGGEPRPREQCEGGRRGAAGELVPATKLIDLESGDVLEREPDGWLWRRRPPP